MVLNIGICDDNDFIIEDIEKIIKDYDFKSKSRIYKFNSGEEVLGFNVKLDIIFLDIDMGGIDGIETGKKLKEKNKNIKIIYVTSFKDYMYKAFKIHAFGFINKPVVYDEVIAELREAVVCVDKKDETEIEFKALDGVYRLKVQDIYYFEYLDRKIKVKLKDGEIFIKDKITRLGEVMEEYNFYMPHKSFSVNLYHIKNIKGYDIVMMNGEMIPLSQKKSVYFREKLSDYLEGCI